MLTPEDRLAQRLGLDHPAGWWPTPPRLKAYEAAGFGYLQVRSPPAVVLRDAELLTRHAAALRSNLDLTGLRLILHAPDDLVAGGRDADRALAGVIRYAEIAGAGLIVYHGARVSGTDTKVAERLGAEERSLRRLLPCAEQAGVRLAIENLAPVYPGEVYASHRLHAVLDLITALASPVAGMCLDIGHAHIVNPRNLAEAIAPALPHVLVFHLHDNFGSDLDAPRSGGLEPVKLDLHLPPGAGTVPWPALAPILREHPAPLQLEVHAAQRPEPATLAVLTREVLGLGSSLAPTA